MAGANWITEEPFTQLERSEKVLIKAKKHEEKLLKANYRWYRINDKHMVLIPYDKEGNITPLGLKKLANYKKHVGIS